MRVNLYIPNLYECGNIDNLVANGVTVGNVEAGLRAYVKWCCRVDATAAR